MKEVKAIEVIDGEVVYNLDSSEANSDWIRAARLQKSKKAKDKNELEQMKKGRMVRGMD